jgi:molecular chaperone DnaK (HSP70)
MSTLIKPTLIKQNTTVPIKDSKYSRLTLTQPGVLFKCTKESVLAAAKTRTNVGKFELSGIPLAPRGVPQVDIDVNGILNVTASDKTTEKSNHHR